MPIGAQLLQSKLGSNDDMGDITSALSGLPGGDNFDIGSLMAKLQGSGGLASMASSWLGDGAKAAMSVGQVMDLFGKEKVSEFASKLFNLWVSMFIFNQTATTAREKKLSFPALLMGLTAASPEAC